MRAESGTPHRHIHMLAHTNTRAYKRIGTEKDDGFKHLAAKPVCVDIAIPQQDTIKFYAPMDSCCCCTCFCRFKRYLIKGPMVLLLVLSIDVASTWKMENGQLDRQLRRSLGEHGLWGVSMGLKSTIYNIKLNIKVMYVSTILEKTNAPPLTEYWWIDWKNACNGLKC